MKETGDFLKKFQKLQLGILTGKIIKKSGLFFSIHPIVKNIFFNFALVDIENKNFIEQVEITEKFLFNKQLASAFYLDIFSQRDFLKKLIERDYIQKDAESWFFYRKKMPKFDFLNCFEVSNENELEEFIEVFNQCYGENDPKNVLGENPGELYSVILRETWRKFSKNGNPKNKSGRRANYLFIKNKQSKMIGVACLISYGKMGYISDVGVIPGERGKNYGKLIVLKALAESFKNGNKMHFLKTIKDSWLNNFYLKIGFSKGIETVFLMKNFSKKNS